MLEVIQGEGGVNLIDNSFARFVGEECRKRDILVIIDEVQTGIGRTGKLFAYQNYDIRPDVLTMAKGLAGGLPIGAFAASEKCADVLGRGMHGSTFGGNPVAAAAANYVLDTVNNENFLGEVLAKGDFIRRKNPRFRLSGRQRRARQGAYDRRAGGLRSAYDCGNRH